MVILKLKLTINVTKRIKDFTCQRLCSCPVKKSYTVNLYENPKPNSD